MKKIIAMLLALVMLLSLAACAGTAKTDTAAPADDTSKTDTTDTAAEPADSTEPADTTDEPVVTDEIVPVMKADGSAYKVAMICDSSINDGGWGAACYNAMIAAAEKMGWETEVTDSISQDAYYDSIVAYCTLGYDMIYAPGNQYTDAVLQAAEEYPDVAFALLNGAVDTPEKAVNKNVSSLLPNAQQIGWIAGALAGLMTESEAQEIMDDFVLKLRMARHLRTPEYNELFGGDPMWITESLGGTGEDGRTLVTKNSYRMLHTLYNLHPSPEPNLTVLWSKHLPENWKRFVAKVSCDTDAIQYESDTVMRPAFGDDYAIACCVSAMRVGKDMQFFGARANLAKLVLLAINGGMDEVKKTRVAPEMPVWPDEYVDFDGLLNRLDFYRDWLAKTYVDAMNTIHYMHDKYAYEKSQMALHDTNVRRLMAFGIAGMSCMADSLSAIKYAKVRCIRDPETGLVTDFETEGEFPCFGNDDPRVDSIACEQVRRFYDALREYPLYRGAQHTLSILTITSNVMYGKKTGNTPDGRKLGEPLAPGANPMSGRDKSGALAELNSVAKLSYDYCRDGISNTFSIIPEALGKTEEDRITNLVQLLSGYFIQGAHHLNVNVMNRETLIDAYHNPEKYPNLTIRVSGYAVNFHRLSKEQQREVISRTFHEAI